jgi:capsular polysaccharide biosynthesis protein
MEIDDIYDKLQILSANEELSDIVSSYSQSMPLIMKIIVSDKSSDTQKKAAMTMLEHFRSRLHELYNQI